MLMRFSISSSSNVFDPGRMGSYFQTSEQVLESLAIVRELEIPSIEPFQELLEECSQQGLGIYVTF